MNINESNNKIKNKVIEAFEEKDSTKATANLLLDRNYT